MSNRPFVHLHCHTHYSLLDGANRIPDLVEKVKADGMQAVAITDHGNLYGALEFYEVCRANDVNPIIGYEAYIAPTHRRDKSATRVKEAAYHLTLLAMNRTGFRNLMKLASVAYLEGLHYKPRIDKELLEAHNEGLICLSGCASSELSDLILKERMDEAKKLIAWYERVFGDRFYLEIQNAGLEIQRRCAEGTIDLARQMGLPLVATNDAHYLNRDDASVHDVLLCVNTRTVRSETRRMRMEGDQFYVRSPEEMYAAFPDHADAVARTQEIAGRVDIDLNFNVRHFPVFHPPEGKSDIDYLRELCEAGLKERYGDAVTDEHRRRLDYELSVIERMGYASYFLIVWDFVRFALENGIPCQARGSACGALVAYVLKLSNVCPLEYDLLFERFLDPSRTEPPDIDIDFCRDRRQLVIEYTKQKYGEANVAQIGTFGTLKAKAVIRDVGRALSVPLARVNEIAGMVPDRLNITLREALQESPDLKEAYDRDQQVREMIDIGMRLEGLARSAGTHAAGVVIADRPLSEYVPLQTITGKDDVVTQWDGAGVERAGLLKMDFLGLRNLTILDKAVRNVKRHRNIDIDPATIPLDDEATFRLLARGETKGIFQLEGGGIRKLLIEMKPDSFRDIIATSALYRPGPLEGGMVGTYVDVKHKRKPVPTVHPIVDEILAETYGVMVYQEQVMRILNRVGGIELSSAYRCIKAISKKKLKIIAKFSEEFVEGAQQRGLSEAKAVELFQMIEKFAGYGFNKSHSTAYALVAYQTAYLKAHFPREFMAALLSCGMEDSNRLAEHVDDCRRMGIEVLPPDINRSDVEFGVDGDRLTFGLAAIKGLGEQAARAIVAEREANGPYRSLYDLCQRVDPKHINRAALEVLIKAHALDSLGPTQAQHMEMAERCLQAAAAAHRDRQRGQKNLFGTDEDESTGGADAADQHLPDVPDWPNAQKLAYEKEALGFYLTSHPLSREAERLERLATHTAVEVGQLQDGDEVVLAGMVSAIKRSATKKPSRNGHTRYVNFDLEDVTGTVRCILWPEGFARMGEKVEPEAILVVQARVDRRGREPSLIVDNLLTLDEAERQFTRHVAIRLRQGIHSGADMSRVRSILERYPGGTDVLLIVDSADEDNPEVRWRYVLTVGPQLRVRCTPELRAELEEAVGPGHFEFHVPKRRTTARPGNGTSPANRPLPAGV